MFQVLLSVSSFSKYLFLKVSLCHHIQVFNAVLDCSATIFDGEIENSILSPGNETVTFELV